MRWDHPQLGLLPPLKFLPLAEEAGLMRTLTAFVLDAGARAVRGVAGRAGSTLAVSVNVSASNLLDPGFAGAGPTSCSSVHDLPADALVLEITETSIISDFEPVAAASSRSSATSAWSCRSTTSAPASPRSPT